MKASFVLYSSMSNYLPLHPSIHPSIQQQCRNNQRVWLTACSQWCNCNCNVRWCIAHCTYIPDAVYMYIQYVHAVHQVGTYILCMYSSAAQQVRQAK